MSTCWFCKFMPKVYQHALRKHIACQKFLVHCGPMRRWSDVQNAHNKVYLLSTLVTIYLCFEVWFRQESLFIIAHHTVLGLHTDYWDLCGPLALFLGLHYWLTRSGPEITGLTWMQRSWGQDVLCELSIQYNAWWLTWKCYKACRVNWDNVGCFWITTYIIIFLSLCFCTLPKFLILFSSIFFTLK